MEQITAGIHSVDEVDEDPRIETSCSTECIPAVICSNNSSYHTIGSPTPSDRSPPMAAVASAFSRTVLPRESNRPTQKSVSAIKYTEV